ncbi:MAG: trigger factor [Actinobacteria bacterium]|nr:trigger factor [Actinomycetota bacterium]
MKSAVEKLSPTRVKLSIEVNFEELEPYIAGAYKTLGERINIPGFRKGKIPTAMIDQRIGRPAVLDEAINSALSPFYSAALKEENVFVIGRPTIDIKELVDREKFSFTAEVDVRPELALPNFSEITLTVDDVVVSDDEVAEQVDALRARFGTLTTVEKTIENGDFVSIDLVATVDGKEVDGGSANDISYEVGTNRMVDGLDEALAGLKAGESKRFDTKLVGQKDEEKGAVDVTVKAVKHRDLPELNDEFAKLASEFETLAELRADVQTRLERVKHLEQGAHARDLLVEKLQSDVEIPLPANVIEDEVNDHLEKEGRLEDAVHRAEVTEEVTKSLTQEILFDSIVQAEQVSVNENELTEYLVRASSRYGMTPDQFIKEVSEAGQITTMVAEVSRAKALAGVLARVKVVTKSGKVVNLEELAPKPAVPAAE